MKNKKLFIFQYIFIKTLTQIKISLTQSKKCFCVREFILKIFLKISIKSTFFKY